jgi:hypothetical protein
MYPLLPQYPLLANILCFAHYPFAYIVSLASTISPFSQYTSLCALSLCLHSIPCFHNIPFYPILFACALSLCSHVSLASTISPFGQYPLLAHYPFAHIVFLASTIPPSRQYHLLAHYPLLPQYPLLPLLASFLVYYYRFSFPFSFFLSKCQNLSKLIETLPLNSGFVGLLTLKPSSTLILHRFLSFFVYLRLYVPLSVYY